MQIFDKNRANAHISVK